MLKITLLLALIAMLSHPASAQLFDCQPLTQRCAMRPCVNPPCNECQDVRDACLRYNKMLSTMLVNRAPLTCPADVQKGCYRTYQRCYLAQECDSGHSYDQACLRECASVLKSCYRAGCGGK